MDATEARRHRRALVKVPVYISVPGDVMRKVVPLESRDISAGGLSFETRKKLPLEADTRVVISKLPDLPSSAHIEARVVRRAQRARDHRFEVALEFTRFVNVTEEELVARIADWETPGNTSA